MKHLLVLLLFAVATPVFAQSTGYYQIPACNTGTTGAGTPQPASCGAVDTQPYVAPCNGSIAASAIGAGFAHVGDVQNSTSCTTIGGKPYVVQRSNDKHLLYSVDSGMIKLVEDTTWANGESCTNGNSALQRFSPSGGINFVKRNMACGDTTQVQTGAANVAYQYTASLETNPFSGVPTCTSASGHAGSLTGTTSQLIFHGPGICNGQSVDAIAMANIGGAGAGEVFIYCKDKGLCAWYQGIDFNSHQPSTWTSSTDLCNLGKSVCKRPPAGDFLPEDPGKAPLSHTDSQDQGNLGTNSTVGDQEVGTDFGSATFPNFSKEDNKFNELFDPNTGGGELVPAALQGKVQYPDEQLDYDTDPGTALNEVYAYGCGQVQINGVPAEKGGDSGQKYSDKAAQSKTLPAPYARTQAHYNIFGALRTVGKTSGLQYRVRQPSIVTPQGTGFKLTDQYYKNNESNDLFHCGDKTDQKQVPSVPVSVLGSITEFLASLTRTVSSIVDFLTPKRVCDQNNENCHVQFFATVTKTKTATVYLPGAPAMKQNALGNTTGSLLTFFPQALTDKLSQRDGFTNKNESRNVLGDSTDNEGNIPHNAMHAVIDTFTKTSSCMLLPAAIQQQRGTADKVCKLEGGGEAPTPAPATNLPPAQTGPVKQYLFEPICNSQLCYDYIIAQALSAPKCGNNYLNPYAAMAIALNETGGLASNRSDGANIKHFGCDPFNRLGIAPDPVSKFNCMVNTLSRRCSAGESDARALSEYGYVSGGNLNEIVNVLQGSQPCVNGFCFRLFVSATDAQNFGIRLKNLLPAQQDLWRRYFIGYLNSLTGDVLKP